MYIFDICNIDSYSQNNKIFHSIDGTVFVFVIAIKLTAVRQYPTVTDANVLIKTVFNSHC
jgi:hypothetical protein